MGQFREELKDFVARRFIQCFPALLAGLKALGWRAFCVDDFMGIKKQVEVFHLAAFNPNDAMVIHKGFGCGQHLMLTEKQFCLPALQQHPVLWADAQVAVIPERALADQDRRHVARSWPLGRANPADRLISVVHRQHHVALGQFLDRALASLGFDESAAREANVK